MDNITVVTLKAFAKQHGIIGYYKLRKAEFIQKLEDHTDVNEHILIRGLEIPRNTSRSVNSSAILDYPILDDPILDDNAPVLQPTRKYFA